MENTNLLFWGKSRYWWSVLLPGLLLIPCGCWLLFSPAIGYLTITTILLWMLILVGIVQIIVAFTSSRSLPSWGWWLGGGLLDIFLGFMMLGNVNLSAMILPYFFAFVFLYKGVATLLSALISKTNHKSWWLYFINGLLHFILAILFFISPFSAAIAIDLLFGIAFIYWGISLVFFSFDLKPSSTEQVTEEI